MTEKMAFKPEPKAPSDAGLGRYVIAGANIAPGLNSGNLSQWEVLNARKFALQYAAGIFSGHADLRDLIAAAQEIERYLLGQHGESAGVAEARILSEIDRAAAAGLK